MMNIFSDDVRRNPYPLYAELRSTTPALRVPQAEMWLLLDYESVKRALHDHDAFSSSAVAETGKAPDWLVFLDPPMHTQLRATILRALTPRSIASLEPRVQELSRTLLNQNIARGEMDLVTDYAEPLPTMIIAELLGLPGTDRARHLRWSEAIINLSYAISGDEEAAQAIRTHAAVKEEMREYLAALLAQRRRDPQDDLLTRLALAEVDGEHLSDEAILGFFQLLLSAGTETTTNLISNAVLAFLEHPEQLARLR